MNLEGWMANVVIAIVGVIGTYAVLRNRVERLEEDMKKHITENSSNAKDLDRKLNAQFKKTDANGERIVVLEQNTATYLDMTKAEAKFVSKLELELHLRNLELVAKNTNQKVEKMEGKLDDFLETISTCTHIDRKKD